MSLWLILLVVLTTSLVAAGLVGFTLKSLWHSERREPQPTSELWGYNKPPPAAPTPFVEYRYGEVPTFAPMGLTQNPQGNDLSLNDLMAMKLRAHYPDMASADLSSLLERFRSENP